MEFRGDQGTGGRRDVSTHKSLCLGFRPESSTFTVDES